MRSEYRWRSAEICGYHKSINKTKFITKKEKNGQIKCKKFGYWAF